MLAQMISGLQAGGANLINKKTLHRQKAHFRPKLLVATGWACVCFLVHIREVPQKIAHAFEQSVSVSRCLTAVHKSREAPLTNFLSVSRRCDNLEYKSREALKLSRDGQAAPAKLPSRGGHREAGDSACLRTNFL